VNITAPLLASSGAVVSKSRQKRIASPALDSGCNASPATEQSRRALQNEAPFEHAWMRNRPLRRINQHLPEQENIDIDDLEPFGTARGLRSRPSSRSIRCVVATS
jgi:hypothetical protein